MKLKQYIRKMTALVMTLAISGSLILSSNVSYPASNFLVGMNTKKVLVDNREAVISVHAYVYDSGRQETVDGKLEYPVHRKLYIKEFGYYYNNSGIVCSYWDEKTSASATSISKIISLSDRGSAVCNSTYKCYSQGTVGSTSIGKVYFP